MLVIAFVLVFAAGVAVDRLFVSKALAELADLKAKAKVTVINAANKL